MKIIEALKLLTLMVIAALLYLCMQEMRRDHELRGSVINLESKVSSFEECLRTMGTIAQTNLIDAKDTWAAVKRERRKR
jgi:hypothetical protein